VILFRLPRQENISGYFSDILRRRRRNVKFSALTGHAGGYGLDVHKRRSAFLGRKYC